MSSEERLGNERGSSAPPGVAYFGPFAFDTVACRLSRDGVELHLTPKAAAVLCHLLQRPGELISKDEFLEVVWEGVHVRDESLTQAISVIRRAIGDSSHSAEFIQTVSGQGYRFIGTVTPNGGGGLKPAGRTGTPETPELPPATAGLSAAVPIGQSVRPGDAELFSDREETTGARYPSSAPRALSTRAPWVIAAASVVVAATAIVFAIGARSTPPSSGVDNGSPLRFTIDLPADAPLAPRTSFLRGGGYSSLALSPDGTTLVYVADVAGGERQLLKYDMRSGTAAAIPGSEDAHNPFFAPDSLSVGFFAHGKLLTVSLAGGSPREIADAPLNWGGAWGEDGHIYYTADELGGVMRVASAGDTPPRAITELDIGSAGHATPSLIAGDDLLLFTSRYFPPTVMVTSTHGGEDPVALLPGSGARYVPTGHLLWVRHGQWVGAPFDAGRRELTGDPVVLMDGVRRGAWAGTAHATWSRRGRLLYAPGSNLRAGQLVWVDPRSDEVEPLGLGTGTYNAFFISPDGSKLAYTLIDGADSSVWLYDFARRIPEPLTRGPSDRAVGWMPAGDAVLFTSRRPDGGALYRVGLAASDREPIELIGEAIPNAMATPHGLAYQNSDQDIAFAPFGDDGQTVAFLDSVKIRATPDLEAFPAVSPDGKWLAYMSDETGAFEVWVVDFPEASTPVRVSSNGADEPRWSPDGSAIIYIKGNHVLSRSFSVERGVVLGPERELFERPFLNLGGYSWDLVPHGDGVRFLVVENPDIARPLTRLEGMENFFTWLQERIPTGASKRHPEEGSR